MEDRLLFDLAGPAFMNLARTKTGAA